MWLNCIFGGKGVGMINLLLYLIVGVFIAGLMVGRTPEYLGKKVEAREMKLAMLALLVHPIMILMPAGHFRRHRHGATSRPTTPGARFVGDRLRVQLGLGQQRLGVRGLNTGWGPNDNRRRRAPYSRPWDIATGLVMLLSRFIPVIAPMAFAASLGAKKPTPFTVGTMRTDTLTFGFAPVGHDHPGRRAAVPAGGRPGAGGRALGPDPVRRVMGSRPFEPTIDTRNRDARCPMHS